MHKNREAYNKYMKEYMRAKYYKRMAEAKELLGGKCVHCGTAENLELDHIDPKTKSFTVSSISTHSQIKWDAELKKCQLLCEECHKAKTKASGENPGGGWKRITNPDHGTWARYVNFKCRCAECRLWNTEYKRGERRVGGQDRRKKVDPAEKTA